MSDYDQERVLSLNLEGSKTVRARKDAPNTSAENISRREHMLGQTALSAYQIACLKEIPIRTIREAWLTLSHLLLEPNSMIALMGCNDGALAYAMAVLQPNFHIIGIDYDRFKIAKAKDAYQLTNLEFIVSKVSKPSFPNGSLDAVVDSFTLHEVYSRQGFNEQRVRDMLENHFALLKQNGTLLLRDYIHPPPGEYVMMEFPDYPSLGDRPEELSEADLLVRFAQEAISGNDDIRGFFLEELEPYSDDTRLFRLPYKWAYEFILRKDSREDWAEEITKSYTFMTARELRKILRSQGARVVYSAPYWDHATIRNHYQGYFNLFDDDGNTLGYPSTSHIFVARKVNPGESISLEERRPSTRPVQHLNITSVRNTANGEIIDLVTRDSEWVEFLPYRITDSGRLHIYLHDGIPRAITNAVPRSGKNLDGKRWSGHMVEAIGVDRIVLADYDDIWSPETTQDFAMRHLGLRPVAQAIMENGPEFYPNPMLIDERIETKFLNVVQSKRTLTPRWISQITQSFSDSGKIKEFDAQHVLDAISVGLIPSSRLERQILALFSQLGIAAANWANTPLHLDEADIPHISFKDLIAIMNSDEKRFEPSEEHAQSIRSIHSYFVDEGYENGNIKGLAANDIEFVLQEDKTVNVAVVLPLVKNMQGEVLAGFIREFLPVPERLGKKSQTITAPSFNLPPEVKDMTSARMYVAQQFAVTPDRVIELGESYYTHNGVTPQRIFPFAVTENLRNADKVYGTYTEYAPVRYLWILQWFLFEESFARTFKRAMESMSAQADYAIDKNISMSTGQEQKQWGLPPPFGMPIPTSPEHHEKMVQEFRANPAQFLSKIPAVSRSTASTPSASASTTNTGADTSGSGNGSGEGSGSFSQNTQEADTSNKNQKQPLNSNRNSLKFDAVDYSDIDGDRFKEEKKKETEKDRRKSPVVVPLRRPPERKDPVVSSGNIITNDDGYDEDMEPIDNDYSGPDRRGGKSSKSGSTSGTKSGGGSDTSSSSGTGDNQGGTTTAPSDPLEPGF